VIAEKLSILNGDHVTRMFGGLAAVSDVSFRLFEGEILGLIGPNGAGKTTLFNLISGAMPVTKGNLFFNEKEITRMSISHRCHLGIARTFQTGKLFPSMTVSENVFIAALFGKADGKSDAKARRETAELLHFVGLSDKASHPARGLTLAAQRRLEIARALATNPTVLLLDEVLAGLTPTEVAQGVELIRRIRGKGVSILMVEHIMKAVMGLSDRIVVLHHGEKIAEGSPNEISASQTVLDVYFGEAL
jgi:branched-chain amino acid transport system ATP-binding protein